jgi:hypothetical protein
MATRLSNPAPQFLDANSNPYVGGSLVFFENGTTTPKNVFSDVGGTTPIGNSVTLDARGGVPNFYGDGAYRVRLLDSSAVQIWERDDVLIESSLSSQAADWNISTTYSLNDIVQGSDGLYYISLTNSNTGNNPVTDLVNWTEITLLEKYNANKTYVVGDLAIGSDGFIYRSKVNGNLNNDPTTSPAEWGEATNVTQTSVLPKGYLSGFQVTKDSGDTDHDVNFAEGAARDSTNPGNIVTTSAIIKRIDSNWVEGTGAGGFPSALSLSADTVYYLFLLLNDDGEQVDAGFDDNTSATNLLTDASDYDKFRLLGYCVTDSSSNLDVLTVYRTGAVIQSVTFEDGAVNTGLVDIPSDDTKPQSTEGDEYMVSKKFAPFSATSTIRVDVEFNGSNSAATAPLAVALFQDSTADAIAAIEQVEDNNSLMQNMFLSKELNAASVVPTQFKVRAGGSGTTTFNGVAGVRRFGGVMASSITVTELSA